MKVIQIMPEFNIAGAEIMCEHLINGLVEKGIEVLVVSFYDIRSSIINRLENKGIRIIFLRKKIGFDISLFKKLYSIIKIEKPDVIHTHRYVMEYAIPVALILKVPAKIHTVHSIATKEQDKIRRLMAKIYFHYFKVIPVALSNEIKKTIIKEYKLSEEKVPIIYNGEKLNIFKPKTDYTIKEVIKIYHVGRFIPVKNHKIIFNTAQILIHKGLKVEFCLIGDYSTETGKKLKLIIEKNKIGKYFKFLGQVDNVFELIPKADIFILPSQYEGVPMTLIEAMASGLPIVASNVGGIVDMLKNECNALLIKPSSKELADAIICLYSNYNLRKSLGNAALQESKRFSYEIMTSDYLKVYKKYIKK